MIAHIKPQPRRTVASVSFPFWMSILSKCKMQVMHFKIWLIKSNTTTKGFPHIFHCFKMPGAFIQGYLF